MGDKQPDPIVAEVRAIRQAYAARFDYDVEAIIRDIRAKQEASGREYVRLSAQHEVTGRDARTTPP
jgi:formate-dependent phosphoribosylglycinamide formyltransferase (GAR transformylase)